MTSETAVTVTGRRIRSSVSHILLIIVALLFLGPLVYAVSTSL